MNQVMARLFRVSALPGPRGKSLQFVLVRSGQVISEVHKLELYSTTISILRFRWFELGHSSLTHNLFLCSHIMIPLPIGFMV